jgi:solute carrier family 35 protein C2
MSEAALSIAGWYVFSLAISIYNKWMFGAGLNFEYPIFITAFHQFCLFLLASLVLYINPRLRPTAAALAAHEPPAAPGPSTAAAMPAGLLATLFSIGPAVYAAQILPCSLALAGDIGLSNFSFTLISLSLYTMLKTSSLVFVLVFGLVFRLEKFHIRLVLIVVVMCGSVMMMVKKPPAAADQNYSPLGIAMVLAASMMSGLRWAFTQLLLKHNEYTKNSISTIFFVSPAMCGALLVFGFLVEGWSNFTQSQIWADMGVATTIVLMVLPGFLAFMMTLCEFKLLTVAPVITLSVAGIGKEVLTIALSSVIFGDTLSGVNCLGLVLTFVTILWYNYFRYRENHEARDGDGDYSRLEPDVELRKLHN